MYITQSECGNYRKIGEHLYEKQGNAFIHCAQLPQKIRKRSVDYAAKWFQEREEMAFLNYQK